MRLIKASGYKPTPYSMMRAEVAYLEEDLDGPQFLKALDAKEIPYVIAKDPVWSNNFRGRTDYERFPA